MEFKVVLVGDGGVGKSALVQKVKCDSFIKLYNPTMGAEVHPINFNTNIGNICLKMWDTAGQEKFSGLKNGYYTQADGAILMYDLTSKITYKNLQNWNTDITNICGDIPRIICGNKSDIQEIKDMSNLSHLNIDKLIISVRNDTNIKLMFTLLLRKLTGNNNVNIIQTQQIGQTNN